MEKVAPANEEAREAWNGVLFDRFVQYRHLVVGGLTAHGEEAIRLSPPERGDRVLDIGCGFGDTTRRLAGIVGPKGSALGVDVAERFIQASREEAGRNGAENVSFEVADVEVRSFDRRFDYAFSRMGTMFFASPVAALRNVREALDPGGRLTIVVWRRKLDNPWLHRAEQVVEEYVSEPEETDEPTCGPGPFSMQGPDTVSDILLAAGFERPAFHRCDLPILIGNDIEEAVQFNCAIGPAGELIRLAGDEAEKVRPVIEFRLREALADFATDDGVRAPASTWIITAEAPAAA
jgi:SAM-dependent methyltransferase